MEKNKVEITGVDTNKLSSLTVEEMENYLIKYQNGDMLAREVLINGNLKLVLSILKRFYHKKNNLDDLFQVGCIGLIKAIDNFDLSYGVKFSTYAVPMIIGEVKRYIRDNNSIRVSRSLKDIAYKALKIKEEFYAQNGYEPDINYIASRLDVSEYDINNALISLKDPISMYEPIYSDSGDTIYLYDQIEDKKVTREFLNNLEMEEAIANLNKREQQILDDRFIFGKSQMEIAEELHISQAQVSRLEKKAIKQLKKSLK